MNLFQRAIAGEPLATPPIWLMRQAGRYHAHYQQLRRAHSFEALCRTPALAAEVTMGPINDFDFDAAILFSDLLFPLEAVGFGLSYADGPPKLDASLSMEQIARFRSQEEALDRLRFQHDAMRAVKARLPASKGLIGFVGGPWTLFVYGVEGTHAGELARSKSAPSLYRAFADRMVPLLIENIRLQFDGGADVVMIFDTAAGELAPDRFAELTAPDLAAIGRAFPGRLGYYAKGADAAHYEGRVFAAAPWAGFGIDARWSLSSALAAERLGFLQGNFDQRNLLLPSDAFEQSLDEFLAPLRPLSAKTRRGWICGLGHGVLPGTPEANVRRFVQAVREAFV